MRDNKRGTIEDPATEPILQRALKPVVPERCKAHDRLHDCPAELHSVRAELRDPDAGFRSGLPVTVTITVELDRTSMPPSEWAETWRRVLDSVSLPIVPGDRVSVEARVGR